MMPTQFGKIMGAKVIAVSKDNWIDNQIFATLSNPTNIAADITGNVYVIDAENDKVLKFTTNGTFVKEWNIN
jgi:DNA-binding beta-propeller fold protein YncE